MLKRSDISNLNEVILVVNYLKKKKKITKLSKF